jgi:hypothetical protein
MGPARASGPLANHMTGLRRLERAFVWLNQGLVMLMMMAMAALVFTNVVTRYLFGFSLNWAEETSRYLMIWVAYLGAGLAMREGRHVAIEYLQGLLPPRLAPFARGVVVVPQAHVDEVLAMSLDIEKKEAEQARYIRESGSLAAGLAKYNRI